MKRRLAEPSKSFKDAKPAKQIQFQKMQIKKRSGPAEWRRFKNQSLTLAAGIWPDWSISIRMAVHRQMGGSILIQRPLQCCALNCQSTNNRTHVGITVNACRLVFQAIPDNFSLCVQNFWSRAVPYRFLTALAKRGGVQV